MRMRITFTNLPIALKALRALAFALCLAEVSATIPVAMAAPWQLERSDVISVQRSDGETYTVMVAWPEGPAPAEGWPVLWVLDGDDNFPLAVTTARRLAKAGARSGVSPGLVVGISSGDLARRARDYTPHVQGYLIPKGTPGHGLPTGGAVSFLDFVEKGIRPQIERRWPIATARQTIVGHSFGGLLALYELAERGSFGNYAAISPSLWYAGGAPFPEGVPSGRPGARVLLARAEGETGLASSLDALAANLRSGGADVRLLTLSEQSHGSTMPAAMVQTISLAFGSLTFGPIAFDKDGAQ